MEFNYLVDIKNSCLTFYFNENKIGIHFKCAMQLIKKSLSTLHQI